MHLYYHNSFESLIRSLEPDGVPTFVRKVRGPEGKETDIKYPKYLFRGEPGVYPNSFTSLRRARDVTGLSNEDWSILIGLVKLCRDVFGAATGEGLDGLAFAQHYSIPTTLLDVTNDPMVALHFAADSPASVFERTFFRIDLERCFPHVHASYVGHEFCRRGQVQSAWALWFADKERFAEFDLQNCPEIDDCVEKHIVRVDGREDIERFRTPHLLDERSDGFAPYPIAILRGLKFHYGQPFPRSFVSWILSRIPLYDWIPCDVTYSLFGPPERIALRSPTKAEKEDGIGYNLDFDKIVEEFVSDRFQTPNPTLFAILRGPPMKTERLGPGSSFDVVMWKPGFEPPPRGM